MCVGRDQWHGLLQNCESIDFRRLLIFFWGGGVGGWVG